MNCYVNLSLPFSNGSTEDAAASADIPRGRGRRSVKKNTNRSENKKKTRQHEKNRQKKSRSKKQSKKRAAPPSVVAPIPNEAPPAANTDVDTDIDDPSSTPQPEGPITRSDHNVEIFHAFVDDCKTDENMSHVHTSNLDKADALNKLASNHRFYRIDTDNGIVQPWAEDLLQSLADAFGVTVDIVLARLDQDHRALARMTTFLEIRVRQLENGRKRKESEEVVVIDKEDEEFLAEQPKKKKAKTASCSSSTYALGATALAVTAAVAATAAYHHPAGQQVLQDAANLVSSCNVTGYVAASTEAIASAATAATNHVASYNITGYVAASTEAIASAAIAAKDEAIGAAIDLSSYAAASTGAIASAATAAKGVVKEQIVAVATAVIDHLGETAPPSTVVSSAAVPAAAPIMQGAAKLFAEAKFDLFNFVDIDDLVVF